MIRSTSSSPVSSGGARPELRRRVPRSAAAACALGAMVLAACRHDAPTPEVHVEGFAELVAPSVRSGDCPWWRGPSLDGHFGEHGIPLEWSRERNVRWRSPVPGRGHATPIVIGDRVIVFTVEEDAEEHLVLAFHREIGEELWRTVVHQGGLLHRHQKNSHASATPAFDGERIFVVAIQDDALRVTALDEAGSIVWQQKAGDFESEHGYGSSPALWGSFVIVNGDHEGGGFLAALHRESGEIVWRVRRPGVPSYATPIVAEVAGRPQVLLSGAGIVAGYSPRTGELLWSCEGPTEVTASTMAFDGDLVWASGGYPGKQLLCIRAGGAGDVSDSHVVWRDRKGVAYVPSPLLHDGRLYVVNDGGIATCYEARSGKVLWRERLGGQFSASPVLVDGKILIIDESGTTHVIEPGDELRVIARNELGEPGFASLVASGGILWIRTATHLYAIGS